LRSSAREQERGEGGERDPRPGGDQQTDQERVERSVSESLRSQ